MVLYECEKCGKVFTHKGNFNQHIKSDVCKSLTIHDLQVQVKRLRAQNKQLKSQIAEMQKPPIIVNIQQNNIQNIQQQNNIQNIQINLVDYGKEDLSRLTSDDIIQILLSGLNSVTKYVETVHCNPNIPEYQNIYISNRKIPNQSIHVYSNGAWILGNQDVVNILRKKGTRFVVKKYDDHSKNDDNISKLFEKFTDEFIGEKWEKKQEKNIQTCLYNFRPT